MTTYISFLRGVNVGGKVLPMARLKQVCEELKFANVRTYIQSGNVVFIAGGSATALSRRIEAKIAADPGLSVRVITKTSSELEAVIAKNPFLKEKNIDQTKLHVTFLFAAPTVTGLFKLAAVPAGPDRFHCAGTDVYLYCPEGYGGSKLANPALERILGVTATTRNWNTLNKLYEIAQD